MLREKRTMKRKQASCRDLEGCVVGWHWVRNDKSTLLAWPFALLGVRCSTRWLKSWRSSLSLTPSDLPSPALLPCDYTLSSSSQIPLSPHAPPTASSLSAPNPTLCLLLLSASPVANPRPTQQSRASTTAAQSQVRRPVSTRPEQTSPHQCLSSAVIIPSAASSSLASTSIPLQHRHKDREPQDVGQLCL